MRSAPEHRDARLPGRGIATVLLAVAVGLAGGGLAVGAVRDRIEVSGRKDPGSPTVEKAERGTPAVSSATELVDHRSGPVTRPASRAGPSRPLGMPWAGRLEHGVPLRAEGATFFTWDPIRQVSPNRRSRRYGTDVLTLYVQRVLAGYKAAHPDASRVGIGDLSRPDGGEFGARFGPPGHSSHQNGLDVDLYYPRRDAAELPPSSPGQIDHVLAQDLVDRFARSGAQLVFVGPATGLDRPGNTVQELVLHDDHLHVRIPARGS